MDFKKFLYEAVEMEMATPRKPSGKFAPSRMGRCYRYQILKRKGEAESDPVGPQLQMTFDIGTMVHRYIQAKLPAKACEVPYESDDIKGFCDYVDEDSVTDFKTVGFYVWNRLKNANDATICSVKKVDCYQLMTYAYLLDKPKGFLVYIKKDNMELKQFTLYLDEWRDEVKTELETLRDYWESQTLPTGFPRAYDGKECGYCAYSSTCPDRRDPPPKKPTTKLKAKKSRAF